MLNEDEKSVDKRESNAIDFLRKKVNSDKNNQGSVKKTRSRQESDYTNVDAVISNFNNYFLLKVLSPQIQQNEDKKREHKEIMLRSIVFFIKVQFFLLFFLVSGTLSAIFFFHACHNDMTDETFKIIIGFLGVYITSIVVELIYIAKYIVINVFDTSIDGLVKLFSSNNLENNIGSKKDN